MEYPTSKDWRWSDARLLFEVPHRKGNEKYQEHNYEEW
jgi:hypothetical protein